MAHYFQRDGIVDKTIVRGTQDQLNGRQKQQAGTTTEYATQHKRLDITDTDLSFYPGDYVYVYGKKRFGQIEALLIIDDCQWADISMFGEHHMDEETGILNADDNLEDNFELHKLTDLSNSLVTCEEFQIRWFVSFNFNVERFSWYNEHVSL